MDGFDHSTAPQAYLDIQWIPDTLVSLMGVGWIINYLGLLRGSFRDQTYGMAIIPLCCNFAWEAVYSFVYPPKGISEQVVFTILLFINLGVMYAAIKFSPREWGHAPLVQNNLPFIFAIGIFTFLTGQLALAVEIGPSLAYNWGALFSQVVLSIGALTQLLSRGSTRGGSYTLWLSRALGSSCAIVTATYRYLYWPEVFDWVGRPLAVWGMSVYFLCDLAYGVCFYNIRQQEIKAEKSKSK